MQRRAVTASAVLVGTVAFLGGTTTAVARTTPVAKAPTSVTAASRGLTTAVLHWRDPKFTGFAGVTIRRGTTTYPTSPTKGVSVAHVGTRTTTVTDAKLSKGQTYRYSLFTRTRKNKYSKAAHVAVTTRTDTLATNKALRAGHALWSPNGRYDAVMQHDGNFVVYGPSGAMWNSATGGTGDGGLLVVQGDGNTVTYTANGHATWSSSTAPSQNDRLVMQSDGNLVIYSVHGAVWSSYNGPQTMNAGTAMDAGGSLHSPNGRYTARLQGDGNFVVYGPSGATWSSSTSGSGGHNYLAMQTDGNLVVYTADNHAVWSTATSGSNNRVVMQDDGNLVVYTSDNHAVWSLPPAGGPSHGVIGDDYPANLKAAAQDSMFDPWRFYNRECTSFVAWRLNHANGVAFTDYYRGPQWGDASNWGPTARSLGIAVDSRPAAGAVAWKSSGDHVAWVADVRADGSVDIEEYNENYHGTYSTRHVAASTFQYIHVRDL